ncbi:AAA-domain-containing protein [Punctularia strigosozonata HHB-11173 SS5]|uniref:AAA-domain-containing protein n=1 Tax=Punctularia strigosozonata (strain HHB-11173) TaxID=741275 RepID=UPI00044168C0|nr:AAA-domain-containing protein [Punctularia strigosozonata HHB-11173 SS5]EIN12273.1 AAA-domain-containing protein [Punctularia strigosozonata HHB-11173 SS5]
MATSTIHGRAFVVKLSGPLDADPRAVRRITVHAEVLSAAKLYAGDVVALLGTKNEAQESKPFAVGVVWPSMEISPTEIEASSTMIQTAKLSESSTARIVPLSGKQIPYGLPNAQSIREAFYVSLKEVPSPASGGAKADQGRRREWLALLLRELLAQRQSDSRAVDLKYVTTSQVLVATYEGVPRSFIISSISTNPRPTGPSSTRTRSEPLVSPRISHPIWTVGWDTTVVIEDTPTRALKAPSSLGTPWPIPAPLETAYNTVGGLDKQIAQIRDLLEIPLTRPELFRHFGLKPPRGILLHGPPGTGKTHLARAIAASTRSSVIIINGPELSSAYHGETEARLRGVFEEAREQSPCIVVLDEIDALCPRREDSSGGEVEKRVVATLLTIMDGFEVDNEGTDAGTVGDNATMSRVVVVATTNRPNAIDPALRRPGRFDREIEIGIPDATARLSILNVLLSRTPHSISQTDLKSVAARAHGYVGADLAAVVREAGTRAIKRWLSSQPSSNYPLRPLPDAPGGQESKSLPPTPATPDTLPVTEDASRIPNFHGNDTEYPPPDSDKPSLTQADLLLALPSVRPSALRSLYLPGTETPVRYSDIGGLSDVVQKLRECVEWPLQHPDAFVRLGVRAPRGVLLYGPPGCSKTMLVRALACESGVNFVSVKGPELLNKFVGESERSVREIFRKARGVAPCILFFDEIDALATSRSTNTSSVTEGVLTSLLTEMDGVQEMGLGVTVVAATNLPDAIDSALMRPGRLDRLIYVGPPDRNGREEILRIRMRNMSVGPDVLDRLSELAAATDGCSGAELVALCQEAALMTMKENIEAPYVPFRAFLAAAQASRRQITPDIVQKYERWGTLL